MSFFEEFTEGGGEECVAGDASHVKTVSFSGKDGEYSWRNGDDTEYASSVECHVAFWNLDGRVLWPGSGPIPSDGSQPLCRSDKATLPIASMRQQIGPATIATMMAKGYTGDCRTCALGRFNGDEKPLCKLAATVYVVDPGSSEIYKISFTGPSVIKALKEKLSALITGAKERGKPYAVFPVKFGKEKVKSKGKSGESYCVPSIAVNWESPSQDDEWLSVLGVEARAALEATRKRPEWGRDPVLVLATAPAIAAIESAEEIPF